MKNILTFIDPIANLLGNWSSEINVYSIILRSSPIIFLL